MSNIGIIFKYAFKDLWKQKVRTIIAIIGVMISVGMLALVLFMSDSIAVTFVDYMSIDAGNQDMNISVRHYNGEPENRSSFFYFNPLIQSLEGNFDEIEHYIPRMELWGNVNISEGKETSSLTNLISSVLLSGLNFSLENSIRFGSFVKPGSNRILDITTLPLYHCAIYYELNDYIKYAENDTIEIRMRLTDGNRTLSRKINFTVDAIFDYQFKWPINYKNRPLIVVDISTLYTIFGYDDFKGRSNEMILTLKSSYNFYDARDLDGSERRVKDLAGQIQLEVGINEYHVDLPKLEILGFSQFLSVGITIIFVFVSMIAMLISGVLINGILKTSVEERIREFGIFRTVGATKKYSLFIVLIQGFLLCNFGTIFGIIGAYFLTQYVIMPVAGIVVGATIPGLVGNISFSITFFSVLISYLIGVSVGLIVSVSPAIKVMRLQLIESIHPYRHEDTLYHLQKKSTVNYKLILVGLILAANGGFVMFVIPRIMFSADISLIAGTLIALLIIFLIGTSLAGLGLMPLILRMFIQLFRMVSNKLYPVYKIFIFRYARRNSSTVIIFAFTFSFVIFTASAFQFLSSMVAMGATLNYGTDLVIETEGWDEPDEGGGGGIGFFSEETNFIQSTSALNLLANGFLVDPDRIMTSDFKEKILQIEGVERVSTVIASPYHLTQIYSVSGNEFSAEVGDYAGISTIEVSLLGIDEEYSSTIDTNFIEFTRGDLTTSFDRIFMSSFSCIISEGISVSLDITLGDIIRLVIQRGDESRIHEFIIVGVAAVMPGFSSQFGRSSASANMGGVMISQATYVNLLDIPPIPYLDKIFIKTRTDRSNWAYLVEETIEELYSDDYDFDLTNLKQNINQQASLFTILDTFFTMVLVATVVICLFGLIASSYSTIIERKKEIGIIRTLGLKGREINRLFTIESLIIMLASGSIGVIMGWLTGLLLATSINQMSDLPNIIGFPWLNLIIIFAASIIFVLIGMALLLRNVRKKKIVDIYRETM